MDFREIYACSLVVTSSCIRVHIDSPFETTLETRSKEYIWIPWNARICNMTSGIRLLFVTVLFLKLCHTENSGTKM